MAKQRNAIAWTFEVINAARDRDVQLFQLDPTILLRMESRGWTPVQAAQRFYESIRDGMPIEEEVIRRPT